MKPLQVAGAVLVLGALWAREAHADLYASMLDKKQNFGAVLAPPALPSGASATYVYVGAPELAGGYRLGVGGLELEGRASFHYVHLSLGIEALAKFVLLRGEKLQLAPFLGPGLVFNTGARYLDSSNFRSLALRLHGGVTVSYALSETWRALGQFDLPIDISLSPSAAGRYGALLGGGAEVYLGEDFSALLLGQLGFHNVKDQLGINQLQLGYSLRLGVGLRLD